MKKFRWALLTLAVMTTLCAVLWTTMIMCGFDQSRIDGFKDLTLLLAGSTCSLVAVAVVDDNHNKKGKL